MHRLISILTLTIMSSGALAQEGWVGKTILIKKDGIKIGYTDDSGRQVYSGELTWPRYTVTGDKGGWLQVTNEQGVSGWFDKADAVLLDDAPAYFSDLIRNDPNDDSAYYMRAVAHGLQNKSDLAMKDLNEVLRLNPGHGGAYNDRALLWDTKREYAKAIADFTQAIRIDPRANTFDNRAATHRRMRQYAKARADFEAALRIDPKWISASDGLAWLLATCPDAKHRDGKRAVELAKKTLALDPKNATYMETLAAAYAEMGDFDQAISWQERVLQNPDWNTPQNRGRLELYRGKETYTQDP